MKTLIFREMILLFMDLFILRHGKAGKATSGPEDAERALTSEGKEGINQVAEWMKEKDFRFDTIATSPLKRARQTAAIVASELGEEDRLAVWDELAPGGDPDTVCNNVSQQGNDAVVLIVGHEPALSGLISMIISGEGGSSIVLSKGGLAKIGNYSFKTRPSGELQWLVSPKLIRKTR
jgi:phosphohistidine phosphatase